MKDQGENSWIDWKDFMDNLRVTDYCPDPFYFWMDGIAYMITAGMTYVKSWDDHWYPCCILP